MKIIRLGVHGLEVCLIVIGILFLLLKAGGINIYVVLSGSMTPSIETGSVVLVDTNNADYVISDIITYEIEDQLVTHRIVEIENGIYETKGDANTAPDPVLIKKNQILGKVRGIIPLLGYVISYVQSKKIILIIISILFISNLFDVLSEMNSPKKKK